jgi:hypothetical protein
MILIDGSWCDLDGGDGGDDKGILVHPKYTSAPVNHSTSQQWMPSFALTHIRSGMLNI